MYMHLQPTSKDCVSSIMPVFLLFSSIMPLSSYSGVDVCRKLFQQEFSIEASDADCKEVGRICEAVSTRAARLSAAGIVALVKKINKLDGCSVAVDGSLYKLHPKFPTK